jgi:hypothetical protein
MIDGIQTLDARSLAEAEAALGRPRVVSLWQGTLVMLALGVIIGVGASALIGKLLGTEFGLWTPETGWAAALGAALLVVAGALRLSRAATQPMAARTQRISVDEDGIRLATDKAESLLRWRHFTRRIEAGGIIILETEDRTLVLLRPADFPAASFQGVAELAARHVA